MVIRFPINPLGILNCFGNGSIDGKLNTILFLLVYKTTLCYHLPITKQKASILIFSLLLLRKIYPISYLTSSYTL